MRHPPSCHCRACLSRRSSKGEVDPAIPRSAVGAIRVVMAGLACLGVARRAKSGPGHPAFLSGVAGTSPATTTLDPVREEKRLRPQRLTRHAHRSRTGLKILLFQNLISAYREAVPFRPRGAPGSSPAWSGMRRPRRDCGPFVRSAELTRQGVSQGSERTMTRSRGGRPKDPAMRRYQAFSQGAKDVAPLGVASR